MTARPGLESGPATAPIDPPAALQYVAPAIPRGHQRLSHTWPKRPRNWNNPWTAWKPWWNEWNPAKKTPQLEQSLDSLEALVERMESGELTLEESLQAFEQGVKLTRECQQALSQAEQKVRILLEQDPQAEPVPFEGRDDQ